MRIKLAGVNLGCMVIVEKGRSNKEIQWRLL